MKALIDKKDIFPMTSSLVSLSIASRMTLNLHSLNNEGGEGNQIQTRMIDIVSEDNILHNVNAISGDMLKHVLMEHYYRRAKEEHMSLCQSCQQFNVNRINADSDFLKETKGISNAAFIDQLLQVNSLGCLIGSGNAYAPFFCCACCWLHRRNNTYKSYRRKNGT